MGKYDSLRLKLITSILTQCLTADCASITDFYIKNPQSSDCSSLRVFSYLISSADFLNASTEKEGILPKWSGPILRR